jgi:hypothetical protein
VERVRRLVLPMVLVSGLALAFGSGVAGSSTTKATAAITQAGSPARALALHDGMRKLWEDHVTWTRCFIISAGTLATDLPDRGATTARLLANQTDIANAVASFYGQAAGADLEALLTEHILLAAQIIDASKAGQTAVAEQAIEDWYANAHEIAVLLNGLNPKNWPTAAVEAALVEHLDLTLEEAVARLQARYEDDIAAYDAVHDQILGLADVLSTGIIRQFPGRFAR